MDKSGNGNTGISLADILKMTAPETVCRNETKPDDQHGDVLNLLRNRLDGITKLSNKVETKDKIEPNRNNLESFKSRTTQQFYVDLSGIPEPELPEPDNETKKNMFPIYINLNDNKQHIQKKSIPSRFSCGLNSSCEAVKETLNSFDTTFEQLEALCEKADWQGPKIIDKNLASLEKCKKKQLNRVNAEKKEEPSTSRSLNVDSSSLNILNEPKTFGHSKSLSDVNDTSQTWLDETTMDQVTDVAVEAAGKKIRAHKFLLTSRCPYFARIFSRQNAGNVITIPSFSYGAVSFAIHYIYSGCFSIPYTLSIVELLALAELLDLEGLKHVIVKTLKKECCHDFHEPCFGCPAGVLECFRLSTVYGLGNLHRDCLRWITKYFAIVWRTITFASLPKELLDVCYREHESKLTLDNFADVIIGCANYMESSQYSAGWSLEVTGLCKRVLDAATNFMARRLTLALQEICLLIHEVRPSAIKTLDNCVMLAIEGASTDEVCRTYTYLTESERKVNLSSRTNSSVILAHSNTWRISCEKALFKAAPRVVVSEALKDLPPNFVKKLLEVASMTSSRDKNTGPLKESREDKLTSSRSIELLKKSFVPYCPVPVAVAPIKTITKEQKGKVETHKGKKIASVTVRPTKAQLERIKFNLQKKNSKPTERTNSKTHTNDAYANTKPRYLEPRCKENTMKPRKALPINVDLSSNESSRNSSPIQKKYLLNGTNHSKSAQLARGRLGHAFSQYCLASSLNSSRLGYAISIDSLSTTSRPHTAEPPTDSQTQSLKDIYSNVAQEENQPRPNVTSKFKSKLPVYRFQNGASCSRSLMNATKSSSAKVVTKKVGDRKTKNTRMGIISESPNCHVAEKPQSPIPVMERSATFSKDDKNINCDKD